MPRFTGDYTAETISPRRCDWCRVHSGLLHIEECLECQQADAAELLRRSAQRVRDFLERRGRRGR